MSLGPLNPQPVLNIDPNSLSPHPLQTTPLPSSKATTSPRDSAMSNVPSQADDDPSQKDSFEPSPLRSSTTPLTAAVQQQHDSVATTATRHSLPLPAHIPIPSLPLTAAAPLHPHNQPPTHHASSIPHNPVSAASGHYPGPGPLDSRQREPIPSYDLFQDINVAPMVQTVNNSADPNSQSPSAAAAAAAAAAVAPPHQPPPSQQPSPLTPPHPHHLQHLGPASGPGGPSSTTGASSAAAAAAAVAVGPAGGSAVGGPAQASHAPYDRKGADAPPYASLPLASSSGIMKRASRADVHEHSSSQSLQSPPQRTQGGTQSSIERRKAHRAYTQKSRNKVNSRFEALLDALPTPPPRLNPRSKAEILEYATETVIRLVSQNNKLELSLALSSTPHLEAWISDQTQNARTVRVVCQPIMRLFTIGLEWKGAEAWAIDSRAPMSTAALGQAWTFVPPSGRRPTREDDARISQLTAFLDSGNGAYFSTNSNEALASVYRSGKPAWVSCEYKTHMGFEEGDFVTERMRLATTYGISDVLLVPLTLYNHVQIVVNFYNMRSRTAAGNPALQPQTDPKSAIRVATEVIRIIARRFCSLPGVSEFAEQ